MTAPPKLIRMRSGFYVTRDAQWRIVRRPFMGTPIKVWYVELWSPGEQRWLPASRSESLSSARAYLHSFIERNAE
jgi:hypothetical protein